MSASIRLDSAVGIPLRDGVLTRAELWRDGAEGRPRPTILVRTPYGRRTHFHQFPIDPQAAHQRGFNLLIQDVRGRGDSDGVLTPFVQEGPDGVDTLDWIVARPWSDGRVVMMGPSYVGATQWLLAAQRHPALRAIAPMNSSPFLGESWFYRNGVREHEFIVSWIATSFAAQADQRPDDVEALFNATPAQVGELLPAGQDWLTRSVDDPSWAALSVDPGALG
ncbi:MAG: CocE/NonD family hydrolase, partial [Actinomycetia bacterium]|nr:CocE/NonD family hydrolase [Actinomycetes bacterium]